MTLISVASGTAGLRLGVGLNVSGSAPRGIYLTVGGAPARGALVVACLPVAVAAFGRARGYLGPGDCPGDARPVLKRIGAVPGDVVGLAADTVTINGTPILRRPIEALDSAARPLPHIGFGSYRVPGGKVWLFGAADSRSWDSRYFGPMPAASVRRVVRPALTLG